MVSYITCAHHNCDCDKNTFLGNVKAFAISVEKVSPTPRNVITPYLHALLCHVPKMMDNYKSIRKFSTSAQELKNSMQTMVQFRGSNQKDVPLQLAMHQLLAIYFDCKTDETHCPLTRMNTKSFNFNIQ